MGIEGRSEGERINIFLFAILMKFLLCIMYLRSNELSVNFFICVLWTYNSDQSYYNCIIWILGGNDIATTHEAQRVQSRSC
jgi:hypothetical protein